MATFRYKDVNIKYKKLTYVIFISNKGTFMV